MTLTENSEIITPASFCWQYQLSLSPIDASVGAVAEELKILEEVLWQLDGFLSNSLQFSTYEKLSGFSLLFTSDIEQAETASHLKVLLAQYCPTLSALLNEEKSWVKIEANDWQDKWKTFWHAQRILPNLVICPSWERWEKLESNLEKSDDIVLELDPGMAFGTGSHETTRLVLSLMYDYLVSRNNYRHFSSMLDVGTGSGILALYAAKLGFSKVIGLDNDPIAETVSLENFEKNAVLSTSTQQICFETLTLDAWQAKQSEPQQFDLVTANIILPVIIAILPELVITTKPGGLLMISGILKTQLDTLKEALKKYSDLELLNVAQYGEWLGFVCRRKKA